MCVCVGGGGGGGVKIIKSIINDTYNSSICYDHFRTSQKLCSASKNHYLLAQHGNLVLKIMLVPVNTKAIHYL